MRMGVLATKVGMTQLFTDEGVLVGVTVLKVEPNTVVAHRTVEKDGYAAVQVGAGEIREKLLSKAMLGHFKKTNVAPRRHLSEFRVAEKDLGNFEVGSQVGVALLKDAKSLDISGVSKGKGYAGVMKRHHFKGFRATHGTHEFFRHGGSIGCRAKPGKVFKGQRMSGRMGTDRVTTLNLRVIRIDEENGLICVRGAVAGPKGSVVELRASSHKPAAMKQLAGHMVEEASKNPMKAAKAGAKGAAAPKGGGKK